MAQRSGTATERPGAAVRLELDDGLDLSGLVKVLRAVRDGDLRVRLEVVPGTPMAEAAALFNEIVDRQQGVRSPRSTGSPSRSTGTAG